MSCEGLVRVRQWHPKDSGRVVAVDRFCAWLALANWCVLLLLFSVLLLAKSLPANALLTGGLAAEQCVGSAAMCQDAERE